MHLRGAYSMAPVQSLLSGSLHRGLLAAGFWNYLREDITFSLFERCPLKLDLKWTPPLDGHYSDQDYLNSISLILARIINEGFDHRMTPAEWESSFSLVHTWTSELPSRFRAFSRGDGVPGKLQSLPSVWFLQPCHGTERHPI